MPDWESALIELKTFFAPLPLRLVLRTINFLTGCADWRNDDQGCQMVCFQTKNPNLGKFWRALEWKMLLYFMIIWNILWPYGIMYGSLV
jgi:hypothetical protein